MEKTTKEYFRMNLISLRMRKGFEPKYVALKVDVSLNTYWGYERGNFVAPYDALIRIADFYEVDLKKFLTEEL